MLERPASGILKATMSERPAESLGSYRAPRLEHARVADAMRHGVLSCPAKSSLRAAARTMTLHHIHTVVVDEADEGLSAGVVGTGVVSAGKLVQALLEPGAGQRLLGEIAEQPVKLSSDQPLAEALATMRAGGADHALVLDAHSGRPTGMLSTLDALGVFAWGEG